jgi:large subunit ribosomal protein L21
VIYIDKVNQEADSKISFDVLMIGGEGDVKVGTPVLAGAKVEGKVLGQVKGEKVTVYKYKSKKNYARKAGHRQPYTKVEITAINA